MPLSQIPFSRIHRLTNALHNHMKQFGYQSVDTPIIEAADLFLIRAGDQVINQLFTFDRHGQQFALRPEFTAAAAYYYASQNLSTVERWQFYGSIFADNPADFGHDYQLLSMGAELIGLPNAPADAEIIGMAVQGIQKQGIENWQLIIGHIGLMRRLLAQFHLDARTERFLINQIPEIKKDKKYVLDRFDQTLNGTPNAQYQSAHSADAASTNFTEVNTQRILDVVLDATQRGMTMGGRTRHDIARRLLQKRQQIIERDQVIAAIDFLARWSGWQAAPSAAIAEIQDFVSASEQSLLDEWQETLQLIERYGIDQSQIVIRPALARNWDYYTGIVFEIQTEDGRHLGGGGRYDELVSLVGSEKSVPAVGFSYYLDQMLALMHDSDEPNSSPIHLILDNNNGLAATKLAHILREHNLTVVLLPPNKADSNVTQVRVMPEGTIRLNEVYYNFEQIDQLITELVRISND